MEEDFHARMWDLKSGKNNDNMDLDEYVADADECDHKPCEERDRQQVHNKSW